VTDIAEIHLRDAGLAPAAAPRPPPRPPSRPGKSRRPGKFGASGAVVTGG